MPGVPSSKACNQCRKVKKKCDQLQPSCSRCHRLKLHCEGSGQQRYVFKFADSTQKTQKKSNQVVVKTPPPTIDIILPSASPVTTTFIQTLEIRDIRYAVSYYGAFFRDIPRMLGSNRALDAATQALVAVYPHFRGSDVAPNALQSYGNSLRVLRETLSEPGQVRSPYTLCAIYLMTICQSWLGSCDDDSETGHGEALAYLLKNLDLNMCQGWFEKEMITTLTVVVIMEGIANPRVYIDPAFMKKLIAFIQPQSLNSTTTLSIMSKLPKYLRDPVPHMAEISAAYYQLRHDINRIRSYLDQLPCTDSEPFSSPAVFHKSQIQAAHSVTLSLLTLLNALIRAYNPDNPALRVDTMVYCEQILHEAKAASCYRPLGAGYVALCLVVALAATDDPEQIERIETIMADYQKDFINTGWKKRAVLLKRTFEYHKIRGKSGGLTDDQFPKSEILCCMM